MFRRLSISTKIFLLVVPPFLISIAVSVVLNNHFQERDMIEQARVSAHTYADIIRESLVSMMLSSYKVDPEFLAQVQGIDEIDRLRLLLNNLYLRPDLLTEDHVSSIESKRRAQGSLDSVDLKVLRTGRAEFRRVGDQFRSIVPFKARAICQKCHQVPLEYPLGAADISVSISRISKSIDQNWARSILIFLTSLVLALSIGAISYRRVIGDPIDDLVKATQRITRGELVSPVATGTSADELGMLKRSFEDMRRALSATMKELENKHRSLVESMEALRKAQDELLRSERLSAIGKMASSIVHDFKSPMTVVMSYVDFLKNRPGLSDERRASAYDAILRAVDQMSAMTRDLLLFSRGEAHLEPRKVFVSDVMNDLRKAGILDIQKDDIEVLVKQHGDATISVDIAHLRRALLNIITNAVESMPNGGRISVHASARNGVVEFKISDTGTGIPEEMRDRIFEPFVSQGKSGGTGLGLFIARLVVEQHGGEIEVESTVGSGTTFSVLIPMVKG